MVAHINIVINTLHKDRPVLCDKLPFKQPAASVKVGSFPTFAALCANDRFCGHKDCNRSCQTFHSHGPLKIKSEWQKVGNYLARITKDLVGLTRESSIQLFQALEEWERHLASLDAERLGCDHDQFTP